MLLLNENEGLDLRPGHPSLKQASLRDQLLLTVP